MNSLRALEPLQWGRYIVERWMIVPIAAWLPLAVAIAFADFCGLIDLIVPAQTSRHARAEVACATGVRGWRALRLAHQRLAQPARELVWLTRMRAGRERLHDWRVIEEGRERVEPIFAAGTPFVVADGHFSSAALDVAQKVLPSLAGFVAGAAAADAHSGSERRRQLQDRSRDSGRIGLLGRDYPVDRLFIGVPDVWGPAAEWNHHSERVGAVRSMLRRLREPGGAVLVRIDALWGADSGFSRPFLGQRARPFALGAASVARLAQCPLIPFAAIIEGSARTVRVFWGDPIISDGDPASDGAAMSAALQHIESVVARYPGHYLAEIGTARRWRATSSSWE